MSLAFLLLPDFTLILLGLMLFRFTRWEPAFWAGLEKLVYYVLFPSLLFYATARAPLDFASTGKMVQVDHADQIASADRTLSPDEVGDTPDEGRTERGSPDRG